MSHQLSNIEKIKQQLHLQQQVKEILGKEYIDLQNKEHFKVIIEILEKPKKQRIQNELQLLSMAFSSIKYFQEMSKTTSQDEMLNLFRELQYIEVPARRTLFRLGDIGKNFYIILSGSVWVLVGKSGLQIGGFTKDDKKVEHDEGTVQDEYEFTELDDENMLQSKYPNMMKVGQIGQGGSFGEIALTNFIPRQATIVCKEYSQFITLSREAFNKFLSEYYSRIQLKNFEFLKSISIFNNWNDAELNQMQYHLQPIEFCYNTQIYREGEFVKGVYFILDGQIEITQNAKNDNQNENQIAKRMHRSLSTKNIQLKLNRCGYGQLFGYLEIVQNHDYRQSKAVCLTEKSKMLFLPADRFKLYCCHGETLNELNKLISKLDQNKKISKEIFLGQQGSVQFNDEYYFNSLTSPNHIKTQDDDDDRYEKVSLTTNNRQSQKNQQNFMQKNSERNSYKNSQQKLQKEILVKIQHKPTNIQSYYEFITQHSKEKSLQLTIECPLIEIQQSRKAKVLQQQFQQQYSTKNLNTPTQKNLDSKVSLIQQLKLPKIFRKQQKGDDVQLQVSHFVRQHNQSVQIY
ncbi:unnamed protein product [Paramecium sonneborni]|uniref:Cyclic nucleotide-binding domain-containing protein n=1 Tax=Paramecium sonneborni TaxID=65129 RepID=A0A8S1RNN2_9CILI|nr:unnamed protein product [Paramecium sonneborni]